MRAWPASSVMYVVTSATHHHPSRIAFVLTLAILLWPHRASAAEQGWIEIRSPHFRVLSDGSDKEARAVAHQFEQIRTAFATALPSLHLDPPIPLLILAPKDEASARNLLPEMWKRK